jgi:hypothetical protein
MKRLNYLFIILATIVVIPALKSCNKKGRAKTMVEIPAETVRDKIRGGLLGQMIGVLNGLKYEFEFIDQPGNISGYVPALPDGARTDDDTDLEWVYIYTMQQNRKVRLSYDTITNLWKERINRNIWCSNRYARALMDIGIQPPHTGNIAFNPWAEFNISGQFICETFGLTAPAMPQTAAETGLHYTRVTIDSEPAQTTQFFTTMIATAFLESDIDQLLDAGLNALDENSIIRRLVSDIKEWHGEYPHKWKKTRSLIEENYSHNTSWIRDNNGFELNTGGVVAALLYGDGDFARTIQYAYNFGWDADCNAATAGTILGTIKGYRWIMSQGWTIVDHYKNTTRDKMPDDETITSFADRIIELFKVINKQKGGSRVVSNNTVVYRIPKEEAAPVYPLKSLEKQKEILCKEVENKIEHGLKSDERKRMARAVYQAICLDMEEKLKNEYPEQWEDACYQLKGYYKIMNNIFYGSDFESLQTLAKEFRENGFKAPPEKLTNEEIFSKKAWRKPE